MSDTVERCLKAWFIPGTHHDRMRAALAIPLNEVLRLIDAEKRRVVSPEAVGALSNIENAINAMMEEEG